MHCSARVIKGSGQATAIWHTFLGRLALLGVLVALLRGRTFVQGGHDNHGSHLGTKGIVAHVRSARAGACT